MPAPTIVQSLQGTVGFGYIRTTWDPPNPIVTQGGQVAVLGSVVTPTPAVAWTVNAYAGQIFKDSTNTEYPVVSNTATTLTVTGSPTGLGAWYIEAFSPTATPVLSYTATLATVAAPLVGLQTVTNSAAIGFQPMGEISFGHLDNGTAYQVSVIATNSVGNSTATVTGSLTPVQLPGQIPNVLTSIMSEMAWQYQIKQLGTCPRMRIGKKYIPSLTSAPYVVFIPGRSEIEGGSHLGTGGPGSPIQLWTKRQHVSAQCWGVQLPGSGDPSQDYIANYGVAEFTMNNVAACIHEQTFGSELAYSDDFNRVQDNETQGVGVNLEFSVFLPITEIPIPSGDFATMTEFDLTESI